jgi:predicted DNA-binding transcriptional regulator AlpA
MSSQSIPLNNDAVALLLGISPTTLRIWRLRGEGPQFYKIGASKKSRVIYLENEVRAWMEQRRFASTSAYGKYPNQSSGDVST